MRAIHWAAGTAVVALLCGAAGQSKAGEVITSFDSPSVGIGMICNTPDQAQQFLGLRAKGAVASDAMKRVNKRAHDPHACGIAAIAFVPDKTLQLQPVENKLLGVVRINVLAGFDGRSWKELPVMVQYAVMESRGDSI